MQFDIYWSKDDTVAVATYRQHENDDKLLVQFRVEPAISFDADGFLLTVKAFKNAEPMDYNEFVTYLDGPDLYSLTGSLWDGTDLMSTLSNLWFLVERNA